MRVATRVHSTLSIDNVDDGLLIHPSNANPDIDDFQDNDDLPILVLESPPLKTETVTSGAAHQRQECRDRDIAELPTRGRKAETVTSRSCPSEAGRPRP